MDKELTEKKISEIRHMSIKTIAFHRGMTMVDIKVHEDDAAILAIIFKRNHVKYSIKE